MKNVLGGGGHGMGEKENCNRKIIPQQWICTQQYLFEPSEMDETLMKTVEPNVVA